MFWFQAVFCFVSCVFVFLILCLGPVFLFVFVFVFLILCDCLINQSDAVRTEGKCEIFSSI